MKRQRGAALLVILLIVGALAAYFAISALNSGQAERDQKTANTLAQAKEALIGFAATYGDTHPGQVHGYLPCPDIDNAAGAPGQADASDTAGVCEPVGTSVVGRLPWNGLGLAPLRDSSGECLWYAISGNSKASTTKPVPFNWDTVGQFIVQDAAGNVLAGATAHDQPLAVILAPRAVIGAQTRAPATTAIECRGSNAPADYLEGISVPAAGITTITLSTTASTSNGTNNDLGLGLTSRDIFDRVKARSDFKSDVDGMLTDLKNCLEKPGSADDANGSKGIGDVLTKCPATAPRKINFLANWQDNLLYLNLQPGVGSVNGDTSCKAVLIFGGERTKKTNPPTLPPNSPPPQSRTTPAEKNDPNNYLEGTNATYFAAKAKDKDYSGSTSFDGANASADIVICIKNSTTTPSTVSFANDFSAFTPAGSGVTANGATQSVGVANGPTASGGCFWYPLSIPLAGKTMRAYYDFQFMIADDYALTGKGNDRGYGFTFQMLNAGVGSPPVSCGPENQMGVLGGSDSWGAFSFIFETDVHRNSSIGDPAANHSAIMLNGTVDHTLSGSMSAACNGTAGGCSHSPANKFEELPQPTAHNQRIEITTGCNATCSTCVPSVPNTHARLTAWVDCVGCNDVTTNLDRIAKPPTIQRCEPLDSSLNSFYFGFTGGFRNGSGAQGVTIRNLRLQTD